MKKLSYYVALALGVGLWGCNQGQLAQKGEYDDLYFSSKDKEQVLTASASQEPTKYNNQRTADNVNQQDVNPDYSNQNVQSNRKNAQADVQGSDTYYDENYTANQDRRRFGNIRPDYNYNNSGSSYINNSSYYDPFFSNTYYDPYFARSPYYYDTYYSYGPSMIVRPRVTVIVGPSWGWGNHWDSYYSWNRWGGGWYDPFYGPSWGYSAWNNPYYYGYGSGWGGGWYGNGGWNRGYYGNNVVVGNGGNRDNTIYENRGRRMGRDSDLINNQPGSSNPRGGTDPNNGGGRGGRVVQRDDNSAAGTSNEGVTRPARGGRASAGTEGTYRQPANQEDYSRGRGRTNSNPDYNAGRTYPATTPATRPADDYTITRPTRPRGGSESSSGDNNNQRTSDYSNRRSSDYYNNSNNSNTESRPSYSAPRNENRSNDTYSPRPSRSYDSNTNSGGYSGGNSGGRSSGGYSGGSESGGRSGGSSGSSSGSSSSSGGGRPPR